MMDAFLPGFTEAVTRLNAALGGAVWGPVMLLLIVGTGVYMSAGTGFLQLRSFGFIWRNTVGTLFRRKGGAGGGKNITPFQAVSTALAGTVGVGSVAGVAGAIAAGGPGAVFWMWVSAFFGMATKFSEIVLAVRYRQISKDGAHCGGPMYYIEKGLGLKGLACAFAAFAGIASFGIGNMTQASEISGQVKSLLGARPGDGAVSLAVGAVTALLVGLVIIGGIKRVGRVTEVLVPLMALAYIAGGLTAVALNIEKLPAALASIVGEAFSLRSAGGGVFGYAMVSAMRRGVARGVFSNEAGLGSAPIAHAASDTKEPVLQGLWGVFEVFIDTIVICTVTALVVIISGLSDGGLTGGALAARCFEKLLPGFGGAYVGVSTLVFAFSTMIGWSYYGERCWGYLTGDSRGAIFIYKLAFVLFVVVGATGSLTLVWDIADTLNGMMAIPNLIALLALSGVTFRLTRDFMRKNRPGGRSFSDRKYLGAQYEVE